MAHKHTTVINNYLIIIIVKNRGKIKPRFIKCQEKLIPK